MLCIFIKRRIKNVLVWLAGKTTHFHQLRRIKIGDHVHIPTDINTHKGKYIFQGTTAKAKCTTYVPTCNRYLKRYAVERRPQAVP